MERFDWSSTGINLEALVRTYSFSPAKVGAASLPQVILPHERIVFVPPAVQPILPDCRSPEDYLETLPLDLGEHLVVLMRSGHGAMGIGTVDELTNIKVIRRYTVRKGQGKAQSTQEGKKEGPKLGRSVAAKRNHCFLFRDGPGVNGTSEAN